AAPGDDTSITLVTWFETMPPGSLKGLVLDTPDIRATYDELAGRGLKWNGPIEDQFWGTFATFDDLKGDGWVVATSKAAGWPDRPGEPASRGGIVACGR